MVLLETNYIRMYWTDLHQTFTYGVQLATINRSCYADSLKIHPKINDGQKMALGNRVLFNHIRQMQNAKNLVRAGEAARRVGSRWALPRIHLSIYRVALPNLPNGPLSEKREKKVTNQRHLYALASLSVRHG